MIAHFQNICNTTFSAFEKSSLHPQAPGAERESPLSQRGAIGGK
jgi:hypothetical protein